MNKILTLLALAAPFAAAAEMELTVVPGKVGETVESAAQGTDEIKLRGSADARDMAALRSLADVVRRLDLGELEIVERTLPSGVFAGAALESLVWPAGVTTVPPGAMGNSALTTLEFPAGVREIGAYAFSGCGNLATVKGVESVNVIGEGAFRGCPSLKELPHLAMAERIGSEAFAGSGVISLWLPGVRHAAPYSLAGMTALEEVKLNHDANAGVGILAGCPALKTVYGAPRQLPDLMFALTPEMETFSLTPLTASVGAYSFAGMTGLRSVDVSTLGAAVPETAEDAFEGVECQSVTLHVSPGCSQVWRNHPVWGAFRISEELSSLDETAALRLLNVTGGKGWIKIEGDGEPRALSVYDTGGRELYRGTLSEPLLLTTTGWSEGVAVVAAEGMAPVKVLVRRD